ncbi:MAG TPA: DUF1574 domain-containing protein [Firmicutes bacterium]|nr:DUF1574 domain-containing protein [Bacillota bacterium]
MFFAGLMNFIVDPYGVYNTGLVPRGDINHYDKKLDMFIEFRPPAEAVIIGSSRVLSYDPDVVTELTGKSCFNFWLPGARTETYYAVMRLLLDNGADIDMVILAIEPESFHPSLPVEPEARFTPEYSKYFIYNPEIRSNAFQKAGLLFSFSQMGESITQINRLIKAQAGQDKLDYRPNGFATWRHWEKQIEDGTFNLESRIDERVRKYAERSMGLSDFNSVGATRMKYWEDFLSICSERNIRVVAFIPPNHPRLAKILRELEADSVIATVSDYLAETISGVGGVFADYSDIESFSGDPNDFYDEIHMRPKNGELLLKHLFSHNAGNRSYEEEHE